MGWAVTAVIAAVYTLIIVRNKIKARLAKSTAESAKAVAEV